MSPYLLVALCKVALLIVPTCDVADMLYAQKRIFMMFFTHVKELTAIFATRSTVLLVVRLIPSAGIIFIMADLV